jgi:WD40 repeat protein
MAHMGEPFQLRGECSSLVSESAEHANQRLWRLGYWASTSVSFVFSVAALLAAGAAPAPKAKPCDDPPAAKPFRPSAQATLPTGAVLIGRSQGSLPGRTFFTGDGKTLIVVSGSTKVHWRDVDSGKQIGELVLEGRHFDAAFAADANVLAVTGMRQLDGKLDRREGVLWLINATRRQLVQTVALPSEQRANPRHLQVSADGKRVFLEHEGDILVIDGMSGELLNRHTAKINAGALAASRDGKLVAFGRYDLFLWRWETGEEPNKFAAIGGFGTEHMRFSPDAKTLYAVPHGEVVTVWDVATARQTESRPLRTMAGDLAFSPDGKVLAICSHSGAANPPAGGHAVDLLDPVTWRQVGRLPVGRTGVELLAWSKDGSRLAAVSEHRTWVWDAKTGQVLGPSQSGHEGLIAAMAFGSDGTLYTASDDHTIRSWDSVTGAPKLEMVHDEWVCDLALSPDGKLVVGSALRNDLRVWDARTGKPRFKLLGNGRLGGKRRVRFTLDGQRLIAWGDDEFVRVWNVQNGKLISEYSTRPPQDKGDPDDPLFEMEREMDRGIEAIDISADGTALAISDKGSIRVIDPMTGKELKTLIFGDRFIQETAFAPGGKLIAVAFLGRTVQKKLADGRVNFSREREFPFAVCDVASGKQIWSATAEGSWSRLAYSPDGSRIAMVSNVSQGPNQVDSRVAVWNGATGAQCGQIELPTRGFNVAFDQTGQRLAVSLEDATAIVYKLETALKPFSKREP